MNVHQAMVEVRESGNQSQFDEWLSEFCGSPHLCSGIVNAIANDFRHPLFLEFVRSDECIGLISGYLEDIRCGLIGRKNAIFRSYSGIVVKAGGGGDYQACMAALKNYGKKKWMVSF